MRELQSRELIGIGTLLVGKTRRWTEEEGSQKKHSSLNREKLPASGPARRRKSIKERKRNRIDDDSFEGLSAGGKGKPKREKLNQGREKSTQIRLNAG